MSNRRPALGAAGRIIWIMLVADALIENGLVPAISEVASVTNLAIGDTGPSGAQRPRLLDRVREAIRARHFSRRTEEAYTAWVRRYIIVVRAGKGGGIV